MALMCVAVSCGGEAPQPKVADTPAEVARFALEVRTFTLKNGLRVILQEDHHSPFVAINVLYHVGSKDDPRARSGFAHLFEHLMYEGSKHVKRGDHARLLERVGTLESNASTDLDHTSFHETVPASELELALWLESDRMAYLGDGLTEESLANVKSVVKNERRMRVEDVPYGMVHAITRAALYPSDHPYHYATIGVAADLDAATLDEVRAFWERYYVPNDATLSLVGDFREKDALAAVAKYFGPIPKGKDPSPIEKIPMVDLAKPRTLQMAASVTNTRVVVTWPTKPVFADTHCHFVLLTRFLEEPLVRELVTERHTAKHVKLRYDAGLLGGLFEVSVDVADGVNPTTVRKSIGEIVDREAQFRIYESSVRWAESSAFVNVVFALESLASRAQSFNVFDHVTGNPIYALPLLRSFHAVKGEAMRKTLEEFLSRSPSITTVIKATPSAPVAGVLVREDD